MQSLYSEQKWNDIRAQLNRRQAVLLGIMIALLGGIVWFLATENHKDHRPEIQVTLLVILLCASVIFFYDVFLRPLRAYARHVDSSLHGRAHEVTVVFDHVNEEESLVDGVSYRDLIFLGEADKHGDRERMFYWDSELPLPSFSRGQEVTLRYFDKFITGYQV